MVESIIKETDVDPCAEQETEDLGALGFFTSLRYILLLDKFALLFIRKLMVVIHFQALVRMKALQDRCIIEEAVISRLRKSNETLTNEQD